MTSPEELKAIAPEIIKKYNKKNNFKGLLQFFNTLVPYFALFYLAMISLEKSVLLSIVLMIALSFFIVRVFMLMHDCGHKCMFSSPLLNTLGGFISGVIVGMPYYVWAQHHNFHHSTNGDWERYRGPLDVMSVSEFNNISDKQKKRYQLSRSIYLAIPGAFLYFVFNPRFNWIKGSLQFVIHTIKTKLTNSSQSLQEISSSFETRLWKNKKEYIHMTLNNIVLLSSWYFASMYFGTTAFFTVYLVSLCLAGAAGLIIFTIQHNFEGSYATDTKHWNYYQAALEGTSILTFPKLIEWFGLNICYHHIHHLSSSIPNYNLAAAHKEYAHLFDSVKRIRLTDVPKSFRYILWDESSEKMISIDDYHRLYTAS